MKPCPFCREEVREEAIKCRYCGSSLLPVQPVAEPVTQNSVAGKPQSGLDQVVYIVDQDLIRFGKFVVAALALFILVGTFFFGFNLKETGEEVRKNADNTAANSQAAATNAQMAAQTSTQLRAVQEAVQKDKAQTDELLAKATESLKAVQAESDKVKAAAETASESSQSARVSQQQAQAVLDEANKHLVSTKELETQVRQNANVIFASSSPAVPAGAHAPAGKPTDSSALSSPPPPTPVAGAVAGTTKTQSSFTPPELKRLYDFPMELDGRGQTIGFVELGGGYTDADLTQYFGALGLKKPAISVVSVDGANNSPVGNANSADSEVLENIEVAGSVAPAADLVVYYAPNTTSGFLNAISTALNDKVHRLSVLVIGWGSNESTWTAQIRDAMNRALSTAQLEGITVLVAAGDSGGGEIDFPASSPWVLAVGGTRLLASDENIVDEIAWNDGKQGGATGGGISEFFARPAWQARLPMPPGKTGYPGRGFPDVSANADPKTGYRVRVDGSETVIGGTDGAVSLWGGLIALINQAVGKPVGYLNPFLYQTLGPSGVCRDITKGDNGAYHAGSGWDAVTGWGSPDGRKLIAAIRALPAAP